MSNRFDNNGQGRLNPLQLDRASWYIDGVAVTATADQLNNAGGAFHRQVKPISTDSYTLDPLDNAFILFFEANSNNRTLNLPNTIAPNFINGFEFLIFVSLESGVLTLNDPLNITEPTLQLSPGQGAIVDLVFDESNNPHWVLNTDHPIVKVKTLTTNYTLVKDDHNTIFLLKPSSQSLNVTALSGDNYFTGFTFCLKNSANDSSKYGVFLPTGSNQADYFHNGAVGLNQSVTYTLDKGDATGNFASIATSGFGQDFHAIINAASLTTLNFNHQGAILILPNDNSTKILTLPDHTQVDLRQGFWCYVYNPGGSTATVSSTDTIDGIASIPPGVSVKLFKRFYGLPGIWTIFRDSLNDVLNNLSLLDSTVGLLTQVTSNTFTKRVLSDSSDISWTNRDGVSGNPSAALIPAGARSSLSLNPDFNSFSSAVDVTLANPLASVIFANFTAGGKKLIFPAANASNSFLKGRLLLLYNSNASNSFSVVLQDGSTAAFTALANTWYLLCFSDISTANGTMVSFQLASMSAQSASNVAITGGNIDNTIIGNSTPAAGTFTTLKFRNNANTFSSTIQNTATAARTYTFQDRDGTIADNTDLAGKVSTSTTVSAGGLLTGGGALSSNVTITLSPSAVLQPVNNLSDLNSASTARTNLGLGNAAVKGVTDNTKANVASVSGTFTTGHFASFADTSGTIQDSTFSSSSFLQVANNLSDLNSASTARTNLGLGNAAVKGVTDNTKANVASVSGTFTTGHFASFADTSGTIQDSTFSSSSFLQVANNLSDLNSASTARTNLGLGNAAVKGVTDNTKANVASVSGTFTTGHFASFADTSGTIQDSTFSSSSFLQVSNNLSDLNSASTARTNLGLGNAAVKGVTDNTKANVVSMSGTSTSGNVPKFADANGTIQDSGTAFSSLATIGLQIGTTLTSNTTLTSGQNGQLVPVNFTSAGNITLPKQTTAALSAGYYVQLINIGLTDVTFLHESGDIVEGQTYTLGPGASARVILKSAGTPNTWEIEGGTLFVPVQYHWAPVGTIGNGTYVLSGGVDTDFTVTDIYFRSNSGSGNAQVNSQAGSMNLLSFSGSLNSLIGVTTNASVTQGSDLTIVLTSTSSLVNPAATVRGYRRLNI